MIAWHIIAGEYPPAIGGVAQYTRIVAKGLALRDDEVHVWAPTVSSLAHDDRVIEHRLPDHFGPKSMRLLRSQIGQEHNSRLLVQYVPHSLGRRAVNLRFCFWLSFLRNIAVDVMFHEVALGLNRRGQPLRHRALAAIQQIMAILTVRSAARVFVSIPAWQAMIAPYMRTGTSLKWLPVPSTVPVMESAARLRDLRTGLATAGPIVGHFGSYGSMITSLLAPALLELCKARSDVTVLLIGRGSESFARDLLSRERSLEGRVRATGVLDKESISLHISNCDLMLQPYPDGVSTRRTSVMAALEHGRPVLTTDGALTEDFWRRSCAVALVRVSEITDTCRIAVQLLQDSKLRAQMSRSARVLYCNNFDVRHTIHALRNLPCV